MIAVFQKKSVNDTITTSKKRFRKDDDAMKYLKFILWKSFRMKAEMTDDEALAYSETFKKYKDNQNTEGVWLEAI
jgi:hypothetical protein